MSTMSDLEGTTYRRLGVLLIAIGLVCAAGSHLGFPVAYKLWPLLTLSLGIGFAGIFARSRTRSVVYLALGEYLILFSSLALYCNFTSWRNLGQLWPLFIAFLGVVLASLLVFRRGSRLLPFLALLFLFVVGVPVPHLHLWRPVLVVDPCPCRPDHSRVWNAQMSKKSVVFIEPSGNKTNVFDDYMRLPLMGSLYLGTILDARGYGVRILNENILSREIDPFGIHADVFCITALTVSATRAKLLASQLKRIYPKSLVIVGGIHASLVPEEFADVADHVVIGEADEIIVDLVEGAYEEKIVHGSRPQDLESMPLVNYGLLEGIENLDSVPIMTSRGCPFDCNFCSVTKVFGRKFRTQSAQRIIAEIENALTHFKGSHFFFYDDNFTANRARIDELCDLLIEKNLGITWMAQVRSDVAREPELIEKMVKAGLRWVFVGFESINDEVLKAYHKSQTKSDVEKAIQTLHQLGVSIHGMFMFGEDNDTVENIRGTAQFAIDNEIDTVQFMIQTPLPGTELYDMLARENRLLHRDWDYYNGMFVVFEPKNMSAARLTEETHKAYRRFYSFRRTFLDSLRLIVNVFLDALVWNLKRASRHGLDIVFLRGAARAIVSRHSPLNDAYVKYLDDLERRRVLSSDEA